MTLEVGVRLGPYEIVGPLGAGGMGEVYQASDTRLGRTVALKVLPSHLARDGERRQRFALEAKAISALSHPHICVLHDVGHQDGVDYLVMEYLEGETLAARLRRGPLLLAEAIRLGVDMADATGLAHRAGIVHRDLKPGNVMLTKAGAKLMDFGLAKLRAPDVAGGEGPGAEWPTMARDAPLTGEGTAVGTVGYMAPEQLEGRGADARTDVFALGLVIYEMVTGTRAFNGRSHAGLIASILGSEPPPVSSLKPGCPRALDRVLAQCLAKDPDQRWQNAGDLATELRWIADDLVKPEAGPTRSPSARRRERFAWAAATAALGAALGLAVLRRERPTPPPPVRFQVPLPAGAAPSPQGGPVLSPKGDRIAFSALLDGKYYLFVRNLDSSTLLRLPDSEDAYLPFWSPDGREVAYAARQELKRMDLAGGSAQTVCRISSVFLGGTWSPHGILLFSMGGQMWTVPVAGGEPSAVGKANALRRIDPRILPDGEHYVFTGSAAGANGARDVYLASLHSEEPLRIVQNGYSAAYAAATGQLLFVRGNVLMAQPFDVGRGQVSGAASPASDQVSLSLPTNGLSAYSVSQDGTLAWLTGRAPDNLQLTWFDRSGRKIGLLGDPGDYSAPALSPDEKSLAIARRDPKTKTRDLWVFDLGRRTSRRLTFEPSDEVGAVFSPDGAWIAYSANPGGPRALYRRRADGSGNAELVLQNDAPGPLYMEDWSPDGSMLLYNTWRAGLQPDLLVLPVAASGPRVSIPFLTTEFAEQMGQFSPDSRWIAYVSNESGRDDVYVQLAPRDGKASQRKWLVSTAGGLEPRWRRDGTELFYVSGSTLMAVDVRARGDDFQAGTPHRLFDVPLPEPHRNRFVVTRDGQRFLVNTAPGQATEPIEVLMNWRPSR